jgi:hypothetical protein
LLVCAYGHPPENQHAEILHPAVRSGPQRPSGRAA